jgi:hypothetical protein
MQLARLLTWIMRGGHAAGRRSAQLNLDPNHGVLHLRRPGGDGDCGKAGQVQPYSQTGVFPHDSLHREPCGQVRFKTLVGWAALTHRQLTLRGRAVRSVSTRVQQLDVACETKTKDNVFVQMVVSVQYTPLGSEQSFYDAFYKLTAPEAQMRSYVEDIVRSSVPKLILDDVFLVRWSFRTHTLEGGRSRRDSPVHGLSKHSRMGARRR